LVELSVIIPTYNRAAYLRACLEALSHQTQATSDFEVIVVVDGSTDGTCEMLASFVSPYKLHVCSQTKSGAAAARNRGVKEAAGLYCLLLDDDVEPDRELVAEHLRIQREREGVIAVGCVVRSLPHRASGLARYLVQHWNERLAGLKAGTRSLSYADCYSGNLSMPRSAFLEVGGFAVDLARHEAAELVYRLASRGMPVTYIPGAIGYQVFRKSLSQVAADIERAGMASVELYRRHPPLLPLIELGSGSAMTYLAVLLRRVLLVWNVSVRVLSPVGSLLGGQSLARKWYGFLYGYCYWRGVRHAVPDRDTWRRLTYGTPILLYHAFADAGEPARRWIVPVRHFRCQMNWLKWRRYCVLSLEEFLRFRREYRLPPARSVVITIDDGYTDNRVVAYPILRRHRFPATIFLVSGAVGDTNCWDPSGDLAGRPLLSQSDIKEMQHGGISYGAHTRTHPKLTSVPVEQVKEEVETSRADLERDLSVPILTFAYPYGLRDRARQSIVEQAGFLGACSIGRGKNYLATPIYDLRRATIYGTDSLIRFVLALAIGNTHIPLRTRRTA
jgi:glycosyltransferase involved in cell wall biosynthesis